MELSRREALFEAILLVGGVAAAPGALARPLAAGFFAAGEMRLIEELAETILPQTDTPGARAAKVHDFIDGMMRSWASEPTRGTVRALLGRIDGDFVGMTPAGRTAWLSRFDAAAFAARDADWALFKRLVLLGYYTSEIGASRELVYLPVPGEWRPDMAVTAQTRTWAE